MNDDTLDIRTYKEAVQNMYDSIVNAKAGDEPKKWATLHVIEGMLNTTEVDLVGDNVDQRLAVLKENVIDAIPTTRLEAGEKFASILKLIQGQNANDREYPHSFDQSTDMNVSVGLVRNAVKAAVEHIGLQLTTRGELAKRHSRVVEAAQNAGIGA